jgi:hypothetical protein
VGGLVACLGSGGGGGGAKRVTRLEELSLDAWKLFDTSGFHVKIKCTGSVELDAFEERVR